MNRRSFFRSAAPQLLVALAASFVSAVELEAPPITVTAKPKPARVLTAPASVSVIEGRQLERERGQTVVQSAQNAPGVNAVTTGAGIAKPVVRGLTSQRVLMLTDGVRQEGQQWGDEHAPEIDPHDVDRVEVVRGPQSLLYGPEALSGVINVVRRPLPMDRERFGIEGDVNLDGFSHNDQGAGSLNLRAGGPGFGFSAKAGRREAGDVRTAKGRLRNSGLEENDFGGGAGIQGGWGKLTADYSRFESRLEIHQDPAQAPNATTCQKVEHDKARVHLDLPLSAARAELNLAWQSNGRREYETAEDPDSKLRLLLDSWTSDLKIHHQDLGPLQGTLGLYGMLQKNDTQASEKLVPGHLLHDLGAYLFEELPLGAFTLSAGFRYDARRVFVKEEGALGVAAQTLKYDNASGALGGSWAFSEGWALVGNFGTGWRAPSTFELFVNGEHEGSGRFEAGRADLKPERSYSADLSLRRSSGRVQAELSVFRNLVNRFIFASPRGADDADSGLPIFDVRQANATLIGAEALVKLRLGEGWLAAAGADLLRGQNEDLDQPLPQMPAQRFKASLRYTAAALGAARNAYASAAAKAVARQSRTAPNEATTAGYGLFDFGLGAELPLPGTEVRLDLGVENAFDLPYRDHLSRWRAYALNAGRSFTLRLSVPFGAGKGAI